MKIKIISTILIIITIFKMTGQEDTYTLFKNGPVFKKEKIFLLFDTEKMKCLRNNNEILFLGRKNSFLHDSLRSRRLEITNHHLSNLKIHKEENLHDLEQMVYEEKSRFVQDKFNFTPPAPLKHILLDIYILKEEGGCFIGYQVLWK